VKLATHHLGGNVRYGVKLCGGVFNHLEEPRNLVCSQRSQIELRPDDILKVVPKLPFPRFNVFPAPVGGFKIVVCARIARLNVVLNERIDAAPAKLVGSRRMNPMTDERSEQRSVRTRELCINQVSIGCFNEPKELVDFCVYRDFVCRACRDVTGVRLVSLAELTDTSSDRLWVVVDGIAQVV
jgi:hypothetical protein